MAIKVIKGQWLSICSCQPLLDDDEDDDGDGDNGDGDDNGNDDQGSVAGPSAAASHSSNHCDPASPNIKLFLGPQSSSQLLSSSSFLS